MIKLFESFNRYSFDYLYEKSPEKLKYYIDRLSNIEQRPDAHPEGNTRTHVRVVTNRLSKFTDINLSLAGLFHDLGKFDVHVFNDEKGFYQHLGHEERSVLYVDEFKDWIEEMGGDYDIVYGIVENHMRIKLFEEMRRSKQKKMMELPYFDELIKFRTCDRGGFE